MNAHIVLRHARTLIALLAALTLSVGVGVALGGPAAAADEPRVEQRQTGVRDGVPVFRIPAGAVPAPITEQMTPYTAYYTFIASDGRQRLFRMHVPRGAASGSPLLTMLHGMSQTMGSVTTYSGFDALAAAKRFAVIYPGGYYSSWNAGRCCGTARDLQVDDHAVLQTTTRLARSALRSDPHRLYLAGFSNGGMMALSLACRSPERWAGVLAVAAAHTDPCRPRAAVPLMQVHGTADAVVPFRGAAHSAQLGTYLPSAAATQALWGSVNHPARQRTLLISVLGGGHTWSKGQGSATAAGVATTGYSTSGHGWSFLSAQRRTAPAPL